MRTGLLVEKLENQVLKQSACSSGDKAEKIAYGYEMHKAYNILAFFTGGGECEVSFETRPIQDRSFYFISPRTPHAIRPNSSTTGIRMIVSEDFMAQLQEADPDTPYQSLFSFSHDITITEESALKIFHSMFAIGIHHDGAPQRHISHVLHHLSYEYLRSGRNRSEIYSSAQEAVEEHFKDRWTAEQYATYLTISCVQLNRKLKECCNKTIIQLQHERMIKEIKKLLYDSEKSIKEIAYQLHFEDIAHFNRFFKTQTSITPAVFRRASKNEGVF